MFCPSLFPQESIRGTYLTGGWIRTQELLSMVAKLRHLTHDLSRSIKLPQMRQF